MDIVCDPNSHDDSIISNYRFDNSEQIEILSAVNGTLDFAINKGVKNQNCKVSSDLISLKTLQFVCQN